MGVNSGCGSKTCYVMPRLVLVWPLGFISPLIALVLIITASTFNSQLREAKCWNSLTDNLRIEL